MTYPKGRHPGAVWRKTDFQVHTPRDAGWLGSPHLPGGSAEAEAAREKWADEFVAECLKRDIGAIAVTDHHDIVMFPYVSRAIARSDQARGALWLFPGMEVTCEDSVQCLIIFDQGTQPELMRRLFGMMPGIAEPDAGLPHAPQANVCGKDIREFLSDVFEDVVLKARFVILPHASKGGHKDILRKGFHVRFAELEVDGVYNEKLYSALDKPTLDKIYGKTPEWGERRHGILTTGDNRSAKYEQLGAHPCWVRLGEPTAESIRQAVLADEARISYEPPAIPTQRVIELRVCSSLTGANFSLTFNDGFNALIGGRGSGKSAILEYLRFGLGRATIDTAEDETSGRERDLVRSTLAGGYVEVDIERDGVPETWRRSLDKQAYVSIRPDKAEAIELPISAVQERFRARAFSQKQLSTLVRFQGTADEQITGIAAAESVDLRRQCEQRITTREREIRSAFQNVVQGWASNAAYKRAASILSDLRKRLEATRQRLEQGGLNADQQKILDLHSVYARTEIQFDAALKLFDDRIKALSFVSDIGFQGWDGLVDLPSVNEAKSVLAEINAQISKTRADLYSALVTAKSDLQNKQLAFKDAHRNFLVQYEAASAAQASLGSILADYRRLSTELEQAERQLQSADEDRKRYETAGEDLSQKRSELTQELVVLRRLLVEAAEKVEVMSGGTLRGRVEEERVPERFFSALVELCEKCAIRELEQRCSAKIEEIVKGDAAGWETLLKKLQAIREAVINAGTSGEIDPSLLADVRDALGWDLTDNQARAIVTRLDDARLGQLISAWAAPFVRFEYRDRGAYMPFERASPGQQASALLTLLLNQEAGTLIIDQPEDDLDNRVIMQIVKLLQTTKRKRQLIFATHNPNFVVNGDADKVVALMPNVEPAAPEGIRAAQIEIETDGAIETAIVRRAITDTMEGGREAFELRGRKYAFDPE